MGLWPLETFAPWDFGPVGLWPLETLAFETLAFETLAPFLSILNQFCHFLSLFENNMPQLEIRSYAQILCLFKLQGMSISNFVTSQFN